MGRICPYFDCSDTAHLLSLQARRCLVAVCRNWVLNWDPSQAAWPHPKQGILDERLAFFPCLLYSVTMHSAYLWDSPSHSQKCTAGMKELG